MASSYINSPERSKIKTLSLGILLLIFGFVSFLTFNSTTVKNQVSSEDLHFAIVVDAGSSGSRAYLYKWPDHSCDPRELLKISPLTDEQNEPLVKSVSPGLSSFGENPQDAFEYIKPLMQFAFDHIPSHKHKETPLFILATAGMRLIEHSQQEAILNNVRNGIAANFNFLFPESHLEIISGKQEGIYQWLAINYVLDKFNHRDDQSNEIYQRPKTVGAMDMGGASMQIALEVTSDLKLGGFSQKEKEQVVEINLGCRDFDSVHRYRIFVTTFLGYGANEAISRYHRHLLMSEKSQNFHEDPCSPFGLNENITISIDVDNLKTGIEPVQNSQNVILNGSGDWDKCYEILTEFTKSREIYYKPCSSDDQSCPNSGIKMPPIPIENSEFYGFSEFWYTMEDVIGMGGKYDYQKVSKAAKDFCAENWTEIQRKYPNIDQERLKTQCIKSVWIAVSLHEGFKFPKNFGHLTSAPNTVNGEVVHWTVGALLYRTRFYPLRCMNDENLSSISSLLSDSPFSHYLALCVLAIALVAIFIYLKRIKRYVKPSAIRKVEGLRFLGSSPDVEQGKSLL